MTFVYLYLLIGVGLVSLCYLTQKEDKMIPLDAAPLIYVILALLVTVALWPLAFLYKRKTK